MNKNHLAVHDQRTRELEQSLVAAGGFFKPDEQFAEAVEPRERPLDDPATRWMASPSPRRGQLPALPHMRHIGPHLNGGRSGVSTVPLIGAEMLTLVGSRPGPRAHQMIEGRDEEPHVMPVRPADAYRQRGSTGVDQETALGTLFPPDPWG